MRTSLMLASAVLIGLSGSALAQTTPAAAPTTLPAAASEQTQKVQLRSLQAVLDARERRQDWHAAAQQAVGHVQDQALKDQLTQRLSGLAPRVAKALVSQPQANALVNIDVYREPGENGKQALVSVTFQGLGHQISGDYFGSVLAGEPAAPQAEDIPKGLVFDPQASSSLVFFMGNHGLEAGNIAYDKMKQSILASMNHQQNVENHQAQLAYEQERARQDAAAREQQAIAAANQQQANGNQQTVIPEYPNNENIPDDDGYYYPGIGVPIVIVPNGFANTPQWRARERRREESLERQHRERHASGSTATNNNNDNSGPFAPPPAGVATPPGSAGVVNPPGSAGVAQPPGRTGTVNPPAQSGVHTGAGQGNTARQAPAPPPAGRQAPQAPAGGGAKK